MTNYNDPLVGSSSLPVRSSNGPVFSAFSIIGIICALLALFVVHGFFGTILAIVAIVCGLLGMLAAILPGTRGGIISFIAAGAGVLAIIVALIRLLGHAAGVGSGTGGY